MACLAASFDKTNNTIGVASERSIVHRTIGTNNLSQQRQHITVNSASAAAITAIQSPVVIRGNRMDEAPGESDY